MINPNCHPPPKFQIEKHSIQKMFLNNAQCFRHLAPFAQCDNLLNTRRLLAAARGVDADAALFIQILAGEKSPGCIALCARVQLDLHVHFDGVLCQFADQQFQTNAETFTGGKSNCQVLMALDGPCHPTELRHALFVVQIDALNSRGGIGYVSFDLFCCSLSSSF